MVKYIKYGYGNVTDQLIPEVCQGKMERAKAFELIAKYDGKCDQRYIDLFCRYLGITIDKFWEVVESFRGKHVWEKEESGNWKLKIEHPPDGKKNE